MLGVGENFFEYDGELYHEVGLYFSVSLPAESRIRDIKRSHFGAEGDRKLEFKWFPLSVLREIDFRPVALQTSLTTGVVPRHFVQRS